MSRLRTVCKKQLHLSRQRSIKKHNDNILNYKNSKILRNKSTIYARSFMEKNVNISQKTL